MEPPHPLTAWLRRAPRAAFVAYAVLAAFSTYFCMYAFRKPFAAASFEGQRFLGSDVDLKTAFVISQILGYALSKWIGIKVVSEVTRRRRARMLIGLVLAAEGALLVFAVVPRDLAVVAIFLNGLPLGMVWGLVVGYLEGRRTSELLLAGLSVSFIVASGAVKDVGRWLMSDHGVPERLMPFGVGLLFLLPFAGSVWMLDKLPPPDEDDERERARRAPMDGARRRAFLRDLAPGIGLLLVVYFFLTAYRDFRDNYGVEIFAELGYSAEPALFTQTEIPVALGVLAALAALNLVEDNRRGLVGAFAIMLAGAALMAGGTLALDAGWVSGATWMVLVGLGSYLVYVPYGSVLFDRLVASTGLVATAVFTIYVADAVGYTGSIGVQLYRDLADSDATRLSFFVTLTYAVSLVGGACLALSCAYFLRKISGRGAA